MLPKCRDCMYCNCIKSTKWNKLFWQRYKDEVIKHQYHHYECMHPKIKATKDTVKEYNYIGSDKGIFTGPSIKTCLRNCPLKNKNTKKSKAKQ